MPFVLLLCGLLGGALVSALVISTTLAAGSFEITRLQDSTSTLAKQRQALEQQVAQAKSAEVIAQRASELGMRRVGLIQFINLKTGKTVDDAASGWLAHAKYPGYTP
jgi:ribonuclease HII